MGDQLAPLAMVFLFGAVINRLSAAAAELYFYAYAALMGLSLSSIFLVFTGTSIATTFLVTAIAFASLSIYGYLTKRDLAPMGAFLMMGLIGLIVAMIVNWFLASEGLAFAISAIGVLIFAGLTPPPHFPADLTPAGVRAADDHLALEEVNGTEAMAFVAESNRRALASLEGDRRYETFRQQAEAILTATDRIPGPSFLGDGIGNFWQDAANPKGIWRRTTLDSYRSANTQWETLLDIDALARAEGREWVFKGANCLAPDDVRCLISLSDGGKDAVVVREFDTTTRSFVDGGFSLPEGKHRISWLDADTLLVATDFGPGTLTESGYPFIVKSLTRGQRLAQATKGRRSDFRLSTFDSGKEIALR